MDSVSENMLEIKNMKMHFPIYKGIVFKKIVGSIKAVDDVTFSIKKGKTVGLVGESGCGKTTIGRSVVRLYKPTSGSVKFKGEEIAKLKQKDYLPVRRYLQMILQDPYSSLNPRYTVLRTIEEVLDTQKLYLDKKEREEKLASLMLQVGLRPDFVHRYPHEFSGGQRQRVCIARALAVEPELIICDEAVSALDVSIQAQILNLLKKLKEELDLTYLFISHDLGVVRHISDEVIVMYLGKIVEMASKKEIFDNPKHPYTKALLSAVFLSDPEKQARKEKMILTGDIPSPLSPPSGCYFHPRCPWVKDICKEIAPEKELTGSINSDSCVFCHRWKEFL